MDAAQLAADCEARGDHAGARYWRHVEGVVAEAPALSSEQVSRLRVLIWSDVKQPDTEAA